MSSPCHSINFHNRHHANDLVVDLDLLALDGKGKPFAFLEMRPLKQTKKTNILMVSLGLPPDYWHAIVTQHKYDKYPPHEPFQLLVFNNDVTLHT